MDHKAGVGVEKRLAETGIYTDREATVMLAVRDGLTGDEIRVKTGLTPREITDAQHSAEDKLDTIQSVFQFITD